ncbi:DUF732 domain-containing protein [Mycobacterium sp. M1]|uniref:DUF732 domain-containing protein n=1 Tax=Mycolicibacter acidiphilus TaxID=2835306 RepID=A0ABS5RL50_9MYCO|nr:DUF732 domain-containing protein [Mycolicibacter acidiphilus]MBS9534216.1 DUF732 domain-containing protein [Mycolicibacter acidiphilus]
MRTGQRRAVGSAAVLGALTVAAGLLSGPAAAGPAGPYVDKYGREICDAMNRNPSHDEVLTSIAAVRDYAALSTEDAQIVVVDSISRICPQYRDLIEPPGSGLPPPQPWG